MVQMLAFINIVQLLTSKCGPVDGFKTIVQLLTLINKVHFADFI